MVVRANQSLSTSRIVSDATPEMTGRRPVPPSGFLGRRHAVPPNEEPQSKEFADGGFVAARAEDVEFVALRPRGGEERTGLRELRRLGFRRVFHGFAVNDEQPQIALICGQRWIGAETDHGNFFIRPTFNRAAGDGNFFERRGQIVIGGRGVFCEIGTDLREVVREQAHAVAAGRDAGHLILICTKRFVRALKTRQQRERDKDQRGERDAQRDAGGDFFFATRIATDFGELFGNNLFLQTGGRGDLAEFLAQRILPRAMLFKPLREFSVGFHERERGGDLRIVGVRRAGAVKQQDGFGFVRVHVCGG